MVSMAAARNAIESALVRAVRANEENDPEFYAHVQMLVGWLVEAEKALRAYREEFEDVRKFLRRLSPDGQEKLKLAMNVAQQVGGGALDHSRDRTFHFPHPDKRRNPNFDQELETVLDGLADEEATLIGIKGKPARLRLGFADKVMLAWTMGKHDLADPKELARQVKRTQEGAVAFVNVVDLLTQEYLQDRGVQFEVPPEGADGS